MYAFVSLLALMSALSAQNVMASTPDSLDGGAQSPWTRGRSTFYGNGDGYSINSGACHYGGIPAPYYVAALSDWWANSEDKCGSCFEVKCDPNGRSYCRGDRMNATVILKVTDRCPCHHPNPSNQKWCCGDMPHFDMSYQAFGEIADHTGGWVYLQWREIDCPADVGLGGELLLDPSDSSNSGSAVKSTCDEEGQKTLGDIADENNLTMFMEALWRAGPDVYSAINDTAEQHSLIAPTNEAFESAAKQMGVSVDQLLNESSMNYIMDFHILKNNVDFQKLNLSSTGCDDKAPGNRTCAEEKDLGNCGATYDTNGWCLQTCGSCVGEEETFENLAGINLSFVLSSDGNSTEIVIDKGNGTRVHQANVLKELSSCNGNLAVVDNLLFSMCKSIKTKDLVQLAQDAGLYLFTEAVWKADVFNSTSMGIGREWGLYTALAPTDKAFEAAAHKLNYPDLKAFLDSKELLDIMRNHVIKGKYHIAYKSQGNFKSLSDNSLNILPSDKDLSGQVRNFTVDAGTEAEEPSFEVQLNEEGPQAAVLVPDLDACDGFLDIVDSVLF